MSTTPDMPPPVSPIHGERAERLGFPERVHVVRLAQAGGVIGSAVGEAWAAVTEPPGNILLGWAERATGGHEWQIIAEACPGSGGLAALFDRAVRRSTAFERLAELARLTAGFALSYEGPPGAPYLGEIIMAGKLYTYRPPTTDECDAAVTSITALRGETGALVEEVIAVMRSIMSPASIADMISRLRQAGDTLDYQAVVNALSEIIRRARAAEVTAAAAEGEVAEGEAAAEGDDGAPT